MRWKHLGAKNKFIFPKYSISSPVIKEKGYVILVEGIGCVLKNFESGYKNTICLFGLSISQAIFKYLISINPKYIIISTNLDEKKELEINSEIGQKTAEKLKRKLSKFFDENNVIIKLPTKKDFAEMSKNEVIEWHENLIKEFNVQ
jgi:DNA primase